MAGLLDDPYYAVPGHEGFRKPKQKPADDRIWQERVRDTGNEWANYLLGPHMPAVEGLLQFSDAADLQDAAMQNKAIKDDVIAGEYWSAAKRAPMAAASNIAASVPGLSLGPLDNISPAIFAGVMAKSANKDALKQAEELALSGADAKQIWDQTGWFQGTDGKWRFEIPDDNMHVMDDNEFTVGDKVTHTLLFNAYPELQGLHYNEMNLPPDVRGQYWKGQYADTGLPAKGISTNPKLTADERHSTILHELQHAVQDVEGFSSGSNSANSKQDAVKFAGLLEAAPETQAAKAAADAWDATRSEASPVWKAQYLDRLDKMIARPSLKPRDIYRMSDWYKVSDSYRSEAGVVPKRPGPKRDDWFRGAAIAMKNDYINNLTPDQLARLEETRSSLPTPRDRVNAGSRLERRLGKHSSGARAYSETKSNIEELKSLDAFEAYLRNAGETESRNTQKRASLGRDERQNTPPWQTADVPMFQQIVPAADQSVISNLLRGTRRY